MRHSGIATALLLTVFFLASCITTDPTLGSALVSDSQDITIQTVTLDLPLSESRAAADLQSRISNGITVGNIGSELYSEGLMSVTPASDSVEWGKNPVVRRIYMSFTCDSLQAMRDDQLHIPQNFYVHRLNFELDSSHVNGEQAQFLKPYYSSEPVSLGGSLYTGDDVWSIDLKPEIGEELLRIPMETRDSVELFMKQFYGFCLRTDKPDDPRIAPEGSGRLNLFDLSSSFLYLSWDYTDDDGNRKNASTYFQLGDYFALNIYRNLGDSNPVAGALEVQGLSGHKPRIEASRLRKAVADWAATKDIPLENLVIAKATLEFPFEFGGDRHQLDHYANYLYPCKRTLVNGRPHYAPLSELGETTIENGSFDRSLLSYKSSISFYLQKLIKKEAGQLTDEDDLWLMPTLSYYNANTSTTYYYADNVYYSRTLLNGTDAARHPVLKLTYTVLK